MEDLSVVKRRSVAELAGKFSCQTGPVTEEVKHLVRRRPPRTLQLFVSNDAAQTQVKKGAGPVSPKRNRNSAIIEKLQASLTLSPMRPPALPKSPGAVKFPLPSCSPASPSGPPVILTPNPEETPATFGNTAEGGVLKSINKGRARHSIKRRPPSRRHRKSSADDGEEEASTLEHAPPNGHDGNVFEEQKTSDCIDTASKKQTELATKSTDSEQRQETAENKYAGEAEMKEVEEKKSEDEQRLAGSASETEAQIEANEEPVMQEIAEINH